MFDSWLRQDAQPNYVVSKGLPADSHLTGIRHDLVTGTIHLLYESSEFDEVKEGEIPPVFEPEIT